jgi:uncharacterized membrane protein YhaH (DUF805 family)
MEWFLKVMREYANFEGRARRKEYWMFTLFSTIFAMAALLLDLLIMNEFNSFLPVIVMVYGLVLIIPSIAVTIRRLHDTGNSGWMYLVSFIPLIGGIWLLVLTILDSTYGENQYGLNPKGYGNNDDDAIDSLTV